MASPTGNSRFVRAIGPGEIFMGLTTAVTLPVELPQDTPFDADLVSVGFTTSGNSLSIGTERIPVRVAERLREIRFKAGPSSAMLAFSMAEVSPVNIARAIPGATTTVTTAGSTRVAMPKTAGTERYTVVWVAEDNLVACVLSRCFVSTTGELTNGPADSGDPAALSIECAVEDAGAGVDDLYWLFDSALVTA
jgi:hypothetical protein